MSNKKIRFVEDCKVTFRDKAYLSFEDTTSAKDSKFSDITGPEFIECGVKLGERDMSFHFKKDDPQPFCRYISKPKITVQLNRNSQYNNFS